MARSSNLLKVDIPSMILLPSNQVFYPVMSGEIINNPGDSWGYQENFGLEAHPQKRGWAIQSPAVNYFYKSTIGLLVKTVKL